MVGCPGFYTMSRIFFEKEMVTLFLFDRHNPDADTLNTNKQKRKFAIDKKYFINFHLKITLIKINRIQLHSRSYSSSKFDKKWLAIAENIDAAKHQLDFDLKDDRRGKMSEIIKGTL